MTRVTLRKLFWRLIVPILVAVLPTVILFSLGYKDEGVLGWKLDWPFGQTANETPIPANQDRRPGESPHGSGRGRRVDDQKASDPDASRFLD
jgi:hypothetical protein